MAKHLLVLEDDELNTLDTLINKAIGEGLLEDPDSKNILKSISDKILEA